MKIRFYAIKAVSFSTPAFVFYYWGNRHNSYTLWDVGFHFLFWEIGFGYKTY